jgi:hypothetical protein
MCLFQVVNQLLEDKVIFISLATCSLSISANIQSVPAICSYCGFESDPDELIEENNAQGDPCLNFTDI